MLLCEHFLLHACQNQGNWGILEWLDSRLFLRPSQVEECLVIHI